VGAKAVLNKVRKVIGADDDRIVVHPEHREIGQVLALVGAQVGSAFPRAGRAGGGRDGDADAVGVGRRWNADRRGEPALRGGVVPDMRIADPIKRSIARTGRIQTTDARIDKKLPQTLAWSQQGAAAGVVDGEGAV